MYLQLVYLRFVWRVSGEFLSAILGGEFRVGLLPKWVAPSSPLDFVSHLSMSSQGGALPTPHRAPLTFVLPRSNPLGSTGLGVPSTFCVRGGAGSRGGSGEVKGFKVGAGEHNSLAAAGRVARVY